MAKISCTCEAAYLQGALEAFDMDSFKEELDRQGGSFWWDVTVPSFLYT